MRRRSLAATLATLPARGYRGTTTAAVQQHAGVSQGALLHHFGSRAELLAAAVDHLAHERMAAVLTAAVEAPPEEDRRRLGCPGAEVDLQASLFSASLELWLAARTDADLLDALRPQERIAGRAIHAMAGDLFGEALRSSPMFPAALDLLPDVVRGAAARAALREPTADRLTATWTALVVGGLGT